MEDKVHKAKTMEYEVFVPTDASPLVSGKVVIEGDKVCVTVDSDFIDKSSTRLVSDGKRLQRTRHGDRAKLEDTSEHFRDYVLAASTRGIFFLGGDGAKEPWRLG